jgi:hypothetical protein
MTLGANSYGTVDEIAALTPRYAPNGQFGSQTRPTESSVEGFIDRVSGILNVLLAGQGFAIPITQADAKLACDDIVVNAVVDLVFTVNSAGRFYTDKRLRGKSPFSIINEELAQWVEENAYGFEALGATRTNGDIESISYRDTDESGADTFPIFQRKAFGNSFKNWDS